MRTLLALTLLACVVGCEMQYTKTFTPVKEASDDIIWVGVYSVDAGDTVLVDSLRIPLTRITDQTLLWNSQLIAVTLISDPDGTKGDIQYFRESLGSMSDSTLPEPWPSKVFSPTQDGGK